jgi:NAD(P)-dependent dehydrogenase (short-subunit alcohol dehydrogenase family)
VEGAHGGDGGRATVALILTLGVATMELALQGKVADVTGASRGIDRSIARALAAESVDLAIAARDREALDRVARAAGDAHQVRAEPFAADLSQREAVRGLAADVGPAGIRVNAINPGPIRTDRMREMAEQRARARGVDVAEVEAGQSRGVPLGRVGMPEEVATVAVFLSQRRRVLYHRRDRSGRKRPHGDHLTGT